MRLMLLLLVGVLVGSDILSLDMSFAPGLSAKNTMLYLVGMALFLRSVLSGEIRIQLTPVVAFFAVWILYALLTCVADATFVHLPGYSLRASIITLKSLLIDAAVFFATAFYGLRTIADTRFMLKALAAALCLANIATLLDVVGIVHLGIHVGEAGVETGRVFGVFGHANDTAALVVFMLPLVLAVGSGSRWLVRPLWWGGALASLVVLILTVSRGAYVGAVVGPVIGAFICRRHVRMGRVLGIGVLVIGVVVVAVLVASVVDPQIHALLADRILGQSRDIDISEASSGRTSIWAAVFGKMLSEPITLVTGWGWNAYSTMSFGLVTHNYYLDLWFELGIIGLGLFLVIMRQAIAEAVRSLDAAHAPERRLLIAFIFGALMFLIAVFFSNIYKAMPYVWLYIGTVMRLALLVRQEAAIATQPQRQPAGLGARVRLAEGAPRRVNPAH